MMLSDFGCGIHNLVFEPNISLPCARVVSEARMALVKYELCIDALDIESESSEDQPKLLLIWIHCRIIIPPLTTWPTRLSGKSLWEGLRAIPADGRT
ncbi:MAG: hypothetical protein D6698_09445 [Gammaproteobacteria bacterium]|nr:MAG: hypothetical protein D6698_09445 [Gammaproteobacteria bacterium]